MNQQQDQAASAPGPDRKADGKAFVNALMNAYVTQREPDKFVVIGREPNPIWVAVPIVTLKDAHGGVVHIIRDDGCYVLVVGSYEGGFGVSHHWFKDAIYALINAIATVRVVIK